MYLKCAACKYYLLGLSGEDFSKNDTGVNSSSIYFSQNKNIAKSKPNVFFKIFSYNLLITVQPHWWQTRPLGSRTDIYCHAFLSLLSIHILFDEAHQGKLVVMLPLTPNAPYVFGIHRITLATLHVWWSEIWIL